MQNNPKKSNRRWGQYSLLGVIFAGMLSMFIPGCTHDPFSPFDPGQIDTTGNPVDTLDIPPDLTGTPCDPDLVYFSRDVLPILNSNCAKSGCHDAIKHEEGLILDSYQHVMNSGKVKPFDPNRSKLYTAITKATGEDRMPPAPAQKLSAAQAAIISKWIQQGAKDLTCDESGGSCDTTGVTYSGFVLPVITNYCVGCHSGANPSGNISLNSYAGVQAVAQNGKLLGSISWASGYKNMPKNTNKLSDCKIEKFKSWINHGAPNN